MIMIGHMLTTRPALLDQSERRLFSAFVSERGRPVAFLNVIWKLAGTLLRPFVPRLDAMVATVNEYLSGMPLGSPEREQVERVLHYFQGLAQRMYDSRYVPNQY